MIGNQQFNPKETLYGQEMDKVRYSGADSDQSTYYNKFTKDGKEYYYVSDPMKLRQNKTGTKAHYDVPNLYLAYQKNYPGIDQYVFEASKFFGDQQFQYGGKTYNASDWANKKLDFGGRSGVEGIHNPIINAAKAAVPKGYVFAADPYSYGKTSYTKDVGGTWDSFFSGLGNILSVAAAPLTAGASAWLNLSKPVAGALVGGLTGAVKNKDDPLKGALMGGLGSLAAPALGHVGVTNPFLQNLLATTAVGTLGGQDFKQSLLTGAINGLMAQGTAFGKQTQTNPGSQAKAASPEAKIALAKLGDKQMDLSSLGGGGGGLGFNMGGGGGSAFDAFDDFDFGGGSSFGDYSSLGGGGFDMGGLGLQNGGGGLGFQMPDFDFGSGGISFNSGMGLGGGGMQDLFSGSPGRGGWQDNLKELGGALAQFNKVLPLKDLIGAGMGAYSSNEQMKRYQNMANQAAQKSDPFASQRAQYQTQLSNLMANPNEIMNDPSYKFRMQQGQDAVARMNSARGYNMSGNEMMAMQDYAQNFASQELNNRQNLLAQLGGANFGPGYAGMNYLTGMQGDANAYMQMMGYLGLLGRQGMDAVMNGSTPPIVGN